MSGQLKKVVFEGLTNSKQPLSTQEIISSLRSTSAYSRTPDSSLKPNIIKILKEYQTANPDTNNIIISDNNKNETTLLNKKRNGTDHRYNYPNEKEPEIDVDKFGYKPKINLSNIGGMSEIINELRKIISYPLNNFSVYKEGNIDPVKGIGLCGPPGCGKTTLAYAGGGEFNIPFYKITGPDIVSSLSGESEQMIRNLFKKVIQNAPSIGFIDEIETIIGKREKANKDMERRIVAQIMSCLDEINYQQTNEMNAPVFIIGATSKPEFIDDSMRRSGRFDKEIYIGFPSGEMRKEMIISITKDKKVNPSGDYYKIAQDTPGYLAADIQSLVRTAGHSSINRYVTQSLELNEITIDQLDFDYAISVIQPTSKREGFTTIPNVTWNQVGGLEKLRDELFYNIVFPCVHPGEFQKVGINKAFGVGGYGPPGCGKTLLAKAIANEAKANFISIKGPELGNKYVGESERAIRSLFIRARNSSPCIIFFDELDALVPKRSQENNSASERVVNQGGTEMDGLEDRKEIFIIAATNRPDIIDPAMGRPGRLDKIGFVPLPNKEDRLSILQTIIKTLPIDKTSVDINQISEDARIEGFSGADLSSLVREAQMNALKRSRISLDENANTSKEMVFIRNEDFEYAMKTIVASVSMKDIKRYENLNKTV